MSYASPDRDQVVPYFETLEKAGFNVWLDCKRLKPGQNWDFEIKRALEKATLVIAFLSQNSINRRGYVQRELKLALDKLSEKLVDDIYIVPVVLDDETAVPAQLKGIQSISSKVPNCAERISDSLTYQLGKLGVEAQKVQRDEEISWSHYVVKESWDALPGYEVEIQFIRFSSSRYASVDEVGDFIRGQLLKSLLSARSTKLSQDPATYNHGQEKYRRTNTFDAHCGDPIVKGRVLTVQYAIHWYGAGAAHPNMQFLTYVFVLEPLSLVESLESIFVDVERAFVIIQSAVRDQLKKTLHGGPDEQSSYYLESDQVDRGTGAWEDLGCFIFKEEAIEFLFAPYHVAAYACGPQFAEIPYVELIDHIKPEFQSVLGIEHLAYRKASAARAGETQ